MMDTFAPVAARLRENAVSCSDLLALLEELCTLAREAPYSDSGKKVAVIGSGPAGLGAAVTLRNAGHGVEVFEAASLAGSTLLRLPAQESSSPSPAAVEPVDADTLAAAMASLSACGIVFHCSAPQGQSEMEAMLDAYDAVICACGKAAVLAVEADGAVKGCTHGRLYAAGTCVKNQKVQTAAEAMQSGIRAGRAVDAVLA